MKYDMSCKVFSVVFSKMLKSYYEEHFPEMDIKPIIKDVKREYKAMILRTPSLTRDNHMAGNLKGAAYFFAMSKKIPNMTPELMDTMVNDCMKSDFMMKIHRKKRENGTIFSAKEKEKMAKDAIRSQSSEDEMDWRYTFEKGKEDELIYNITKCGVCRLAEREDCLPFLPCMCHMDFPKYETMGGKLYRTKTLATHDDCCDFHIVRIK